MWPPLYWWLVCGTLYADTLLLIKFTGFAMWDDIIGLSTALSDMIYYYFDMNSFNLFDKEW